MPNENCNCDGSGPHHHNPEVRILPTGPQSNAIVCKLCFAREILYRKQENLLHGPNHFLTPAWESLSIYNPE